jgi:hypothetical protein
MNKKIATNFHLDEKVYLTMGAFCVVAVLILAFRAVTHHPCAPVTIKDFAISYTKGSLITFEAQTQGGQTFEWDFGDGSGTKEYDPSTQHTYTAPGSYRVEVTVNGECTNLLTVGIKDTASTVNTSLMPSIKVSSDTAYLNERYFVEDVSTNSTSWAWRFEEGGPIESVDRKASYIYITPGTKIIRLQVNGRPDLGAILPVEVIDRHPQKNQPKPKPYVRQSLKMSDTPSAPPLVIQQQPTVTPKKDPEKPKALEISEDQMAKLLKAVNDGTKTVEDFSPYLCGNPAIPVFYNGAKTTFDKMYEDLKSMKKNRISKITVGLTRDQQTFCILNMTVSVDKKGFLKRIL